MFVPWDHYMLKSVSLCSESPHLGMVSGLLDTEGNSYLAINQLPFMLICIFLQKKAANSLIILYIHLYKFIFCIMFPWTFLGLIKSGIIFTLYLVKLRIFKNCVSSTLISTTAVTWLPYFQVVFLNTILTFIFPMVMQTDRVAVETITDSCQRIDIWHWGMKLKDYTQKLNICIARMRHS